MRHDFQMFSFFVSFEDNVLYKVIGDLEAILSELFGNGGPKFAIDLNCVKNAIGTSRNENKREPFRVSGQPSENATRFRKSIPFGPKVRGKGTYICFCSLEHNYPHGDKVFRTDHSH